MYVKRDIRLYQTWTDFICQWINSFSVWCCLWAWVWRMSAWKLIWANGRRGGRKLYVFIRFYSKPQILQQTSDFAVNFRFCFGYCSCGGTQIQKRSLYAIFFGYRIPKGYHFSFDALHSTILDSHKSFDTTKTFKKSLKWFCLHFQYLHFQYISLKTMVRRNHPHMGIILFLDKYPQ